MKRIIIMSLVFLLITTAILPVYAEDTKLSDVFTDENFLDAVCEKLGTADPSDLFSEWEKKIGAITELSVPGSGIRSLEGIEYFTSLEFLDVSDNELYEMDLSANTLLAELMAGENPIKNIDISANISLKYAYLQNCGIENVKLPKNITKLFLQGNSLESIDLNALTSLSELNLRDNELLEIKISQCEKLKYLWLDGNKLENVTLPDAVFETVIPGSQRYNVGVKDEYSYSPSWNILSSSVSYSDGTFMFTADKLPAEVNCTVNMAGYPMFIEFIAVDMRGDVDSDNAVNSDDLSYVLSCYGTDDTTADIDKSGTVSAEDLSVLLSSYGNISDR